MDEPGKASLLIAIKRILCTMGILLETRLRRIWPSMRGCLLWSSRPLVAHLHAFIRSVALGEGSSRVPVPGGAERQEGYAHFLKFDIFRAIIF